MAPRSALRPDTSRSPTSDVPTVAAGCTDDRNAASAAAANARTLPGVRIRIRKIPAAKIRDVVKVAVLPLPAASSDLNVELRITADGGLTGISRETLDLIVLGGHREEAGSGQWLSGTRPQTDPEPGDGCLRRSQLSQAARLWRVAGRDPRLPPPDHGSAGVGVPNGGRPVLNR